MSTRLQGEGGAKEMHHTSTATLKSTIDTLVLRCQQTCTVVFPRWPCLSSDERELLISSSDSRSTPPSSDSSENHRKDAGEEMEQSMLSFDFEIFEFKLMDKANNNMLICWTNSYLLLVFTLNVDIVIIVRNNMLECHTKHHWVAASLNHLNVQQRQEKLICWSNPADQGEMRWNN